MAAGARENSDAWSRFRKPEDKTKTALALALSPEGKGRTRQPACDHNAHKKGSGSSQISGYVLLAVRNQSTNLRMPSSIGTRGLYPSFWRAFSLLSNVIGTSPGCSGCRWTMAFLLSAFSSSSIKYEGFTVCDSPRLKIS